MKVLVTGGTGALGRAILSGAWSPNVALRMQSRRPRAPGFAPELEWVQADLSTGEGLSQALQGVDAVIHAATDPRHPKAVDVQGTRRLVEAAASVGLGHLVYVSIVGIDDIPVRYYKAKLAAERIVAMGPVPHSILRVTQFHSYLDNFIRRAARVPFVIPLPTRFHFQPVAASDVARRLLRCLGEGPRARLQDFGGPEVLTLGEAATLWRDARGLRRKIINVPLPGAAAAALRAGKNTTSDGERGEIRWRDWLAPGAIKTRAAR
jgi:uncharacterized protein YbjT (DUF2867 family)